MDFEVPPEAIAVLGKGLGFVPTPSHDTTELRLDARRTANKVVQFANNLEWKSDTINHDDVSLIQTEDVHEESQFSLPKKLRIPNYYQSRLESTDPEMMMAVQHLTTQANAFKNYKNPGKKLIYQD